MERSKTSRILTIMTAGFSLLVVVLMVLVLLPLPPATPENCIQVQGKVLEVKEGDGENDLVIALQDDQAHYYINRGLEKGLDLAQLQRQLTGQRVHLLYLNHWSLLNLFSESRHIAQLESGSQVLYSEFGGQTH